MLSGYVLYLIIALVVIFGIYFLKLMFKGLDKASFSRRLDGFEKEEKAFKAEMKAETKHREKLKDHIKKYSKNKPGSSADLINNWLKEDEDEEEA